MEYIIHNDDDERKRERERQRKTAMERARERETERERVRKSEEGEKAHAFISNKSSVLPCRPSADCYLGYSPPTPIIHAALKKTRHFLWAHEF